MSDRVEFEIVDASKGFLEGRFRVGGRDIICSIRWTGENMDEALKDAARMAVNISRLPPRPPQEMLEAQVGRRGHIDIDIDIDML